MKQERTPAVRCSAWLGGRDPSTAQGVKMLSAERVTQLRAQADEIEALATWLPSDAPKEACVLMFRALLAGR